MRYENCAKLLKMFSKVVSREEYSDSEDSEADEPIPEPIEQKKDDEFEGLQLTVCLFLPFWQIDFQIK